MREYRLRLELTVEADDEDEALAMAYGALDDRCSRKRLRSCRFGRSERARIRSSAWPST
jgi:hypothetical protein